MENLYYKGKGEHSVNELEKIIEQQQEKIHKINLAIQSYEYWLKRYGVNQMKTQKQAFENLINKL